ncbi:hypothetical protein D3C84_1012690 [compost metagenome]
MGGELGAGGFHPQFTEVDFQDIGGFARLLVAAGAEQGADAQFHALEILPFDGLHKRLPDGPESLGRS